MTFSMHVYFTCFTSSELKFELMNSLDIQNKESILHFFLFILIDQMISSYSSQCHSSNENSFNWSGFHFLRSTGKRLVKLFVHLFEGEDYAISRFTSYLNYPYFEANLLIE